MTSQPACGMPMAIIGMPKPMKRKPAEASIGIQDWLGMWTPASPPSFSRPIFLAPCLCSKKASRVATTGAWAKLYSGTGEGSDHSRVRPSHGSLPHFLPRNAVQTRLPKTMTTPMPRT